MVRVVGRHPSFRPSHREGREKALPAVPAYACVAIFGADIARAQLQRSEAKHKLIRYGATLEYSRIAAFFHVRDFTPPSGNNMMKSEQLRRLRFEREGSLPNIVSH